MTDADAVAREVDSLRAAAEARICAEPAAELVRDASGGDPIVYDDEQQKEVPRAAEHCGH